MLDRLAKQTNARWEKDRASHAETGKGQIGDHPVILVKPQTYMNNSGRAVGALVGKHRVPPERVIVVVDDLALAVGNLRVRSGGSAGGHNGLKSIIAVLGNGFSRVRLGIGHPGPNSDVADYVLERFPPDEWAKIEPIFEVAVEALQAIIKEGTETAMNRFNKKA